MCVSEGRMESRNLYAMHIFLGGEGEGGHHHLLLPTRKAHSYMAAATSATRSLLLDSPSIVPSRARQREREGKREREKERERERRREGKRERERGGFIDCFCLQQPPDLPFLPLLFRIHSLESSLLITTRTGTPDGTF